MPPRGRPAASRKVQRWSGPAQRLALLIVVLGCGLAALPSARALLSQALPADHRPARETVIGINLFGLDNYNRQPVFTNLIAQTDWFSSKGDGWKSMPRAQLDRFGWVRHLEAGETAPRPLMLPQRRGTITIRCNFQGHGSFTVGGVARLTKSGANAFQLELDLTGAEGEGAWIELIATDPANHARDIHCSDADAPANQRFDAEFLAFVQPFRILRFLDWQRINDNAPVKWQARTLPGSSSQVGVDGASIEDMIDLANQTDADPWFLMPYQADETYISGFARLARERLEPSRTIYVEFGNEIWNDMFAAARQAREEGQALKLGGNDPTMSQMRRYAQKLTRTMQIWSHEFAAEPGRLVRIAASQNASPHLTRMILDHEDTSHWVDAVAVAPYIWLDLDGYRAHDADRIFAQLPSAIDNTIDYAVKNRVIAAQYGKRLVAYEGGQHLVTNDLDLAYALQRDPRMRGVYTSYLSSWQARLGDTLVLYASTAPISIHGAWGLREYAGQPIGQTPKRAAVFDFLASGSPTP